MGSPRVGSNPTGVVLRGHGEGFGSTGDQSPYMQREDIFANETYNEGSGENMRRDPRDNKYIINTSASQ